MGWLSMGLRAPRGGTVERRARERACRMAQPLVRPRGRFHATSCVSLLTAHYGPDAEACGNKTRTSAAARDRLDLDSAFVRGRAYTIRESDAAALSFVVEYKSKILSRCSGLMRPVSSQTFPRAFRPAAEAPEPQPAAARHRLTAFSAS